MRRIYSLEAMWRANVRATGHVPDTSVAGLASRFPYTGWVPRTSPIGRTFHEQINGAPGYIAQCRIQMHLALESAAAARRRGRAFGNIARAALADACAWRYRESLAKARWSPSDRLWSGHRAHLRSDPSTWQKPWSPLMLDLGGGMRVDAVMSR